MKDSLEVEYAIIKNKYKDFLELGHCEVYSLDHAILMVKMLSTDNIEFYMEYRFSPLGEFWYFKRK